MKVLRLVMLLVGLALLALNAAGLAIPLRSPAVQTPLSYAEALAQLPTRPQETDVEYADRITGIVHDATIHYWEDDGQDEYRLRIPPWENWLLYLFSYVEPHAYAMYQITGPLRALERGGGLCSQRAMIVAGLLNRAGIDAALITLEGHVVLQAKVGGAWRIFDPDYDVVMPFDLAEVERRPEIVADYYPSDGPQMVGIYGPEGNQVWPSGVCGYAGPNTCTRERAAYVLTWLFPLLLTLQWLAQLKK